MLTIVWSERALGDLDDIVAYIAMDSERSAFDMQSRLEAAVEPTSQFPTCSGQDALKARERSWLIPTTSSYIASPLSTS